MDRLHGGNDFELCEARRIVRMNDLHMFDTMALMWQLIFGLVLAELFVGIEHFMIGAIANRMDRHAESNLCGFATVFEEFFAIHVEDAAILALANVGLEHRRRMWTECTIHEGFD